MRSFGVFVRYNEAVWPAQVALVLLALLAVVLATRGGATRSRLVAGLLALLWLWMGVVYHLTFFRAINPAAIAFGIAFIVQGALLLWYGVGCERLVFHPRLDARGVTGAMLVAYALVGYPLLGAALGRVYPAAPTFGLPCPTTIFTLGLFLWAKPPVPWVMLVIPLGWGVVGTAAALWFGVHEDLGLAVSGLVVVALAVEARIHRRSEELVHLAR